MPTERNGGLPHQAENRAGWLLAAALLGVILILPQVITRPLFGDDAYYIWGATEIHMGCYPVRDFFAIDPAGTWAYFCGVRWLFGETSLGYWLMVSLSTIITAALLGGLARTISGAKNAAPWAAFIFIFFQLRCISAYELVGKDMLGLPFVLGGLLLASRRRWWLPAHLLVGVGLAIKPTLGAIWLVWMLFELLANRANLVKWSLFAGFALAGVALPFIAATLWAEQHGWGWAVFKVNAGLRSSGYGAYLSGGTCYKLLHAMLPGLWLLPAAWMGWKNLSPDPSRQKLLWALLAGGFVNWAIQPMFNSWYFIPFFSGLIVLSGIGVVCLLNRPTSQVILMVCAALLMAFVPATNLRWLKLITDFHANKKYSLVEHQSREMAESAVGNTPPYIQEWIRSEVARYMPADGRVGVLVSDGDLLWALRNYRPGFWAVWSPSWNPRQLAEGVAAGSADVIIGLDAGANTNSETYYQQVSKLNWDIPAQVQAALQEKYKPVSEKFGYVLYQRRQ